MKSVFVHNKKNTSQFKQPKNWLQISNPSGKLFSTPKEQLQTPLTSKKIQQPKLNPTDLDSINWLDESGEHDTVDDGVYVNPKTGEVGGRNGPEATRYGDWEKGGRAIDF
jgi:hypothetical protein